MNKPKKMVTEASRENKRALKIADSPKKVTKLKLGFLLEESKAKEMEDINEVVRHKLEDMPKTSHKVQRNPYEAAYHTDLAIWQEYC
jgi:formate dehydrogenase assembly factor FdhD